MEGRKLKRCVSEPTTFTNNEINTENIEVVYITKFDLNDLYNDRNKKCLLEVQVSLLLQDRDKLLKQLLELEKKTKTDNCNDAANLIEI